MGEVLQSIWFLKVEYDKQKAYDWLSQHGYTTKRPLASRSSHWEYVIRPTTLFSPSSLRKKPVDGITFIYGRYRVGKKGLKTGIKTTGSIKESETPLTTTTSKSKPVSSPETQERNRDKWQNFFRNTIMPMMDSEGLSRKYIKRTRGADAPSGIAHWKSSRHSDTSSQCGEGLKKKAMGGFRV